MNFAQVTAAAQRLTLLQEAVAQERAETVRVVFPDHYGVLRGRRLAAERFLESAEAPQAFCDGALVWDIRCDIFEETRFSNYGTGYPDLYAHPDLATLRPCGWSEAEYVVVADARSHGGAPIAVDPRQVLRRVCDRLGAPPEVACELELRVPDEAIASTWAPGLTPPFVQALLDGLAASEVAVDSLQWHRPTRVMRIALAAAAPIDAADACVLARTAARELSARHGVRMTAMPRIAGGDAVTRLRLSANAPSEPDGDRRTGAAYRARLADLALLLRPLPLAYGAGCELASPGARGWGAHASSDANPYLAVAAMLAASGDPTAAASEPPDPLTYRHAIDRLAVAGWVREWFEPAFIGDALALAYREAGLREAAVTAWDLERYWECG